MELSISDVLRTTPPPMGRLNDLFKAVRAGGTQEANFHPRLMNFLLVYRTTPHTTTGVAPCVLLRFENTLSLAASRRYITASYAESSS